MPVRIDMCPRHLRGFLLRNPRKLAELPRPKDGPDDLYLVALKQLGIPITYAEYQKISKERMEDYDSSNPISRFMMQRGS